MKRQIEPRILETPEQIAKRFGGTAENVRAKLLQNALWCDQQGEKAERLGRKVRGATAADWFAIARNARKNAAQ